MGESQGGNTALKKQGALHDPEKNEKTKNWG
jgi:hypothetical protein